MTTVISDEKLAWALRQIADGRLSPSPRVVALWAVGELEHNGLERKYEQARVKA
jgi:hypothetical protein